VAKIGFSVALKKNKTAFNAWTSLRPTCRILKAPNWVTPLVSIGKGPWFEKSPGPFTPKFWNCRSKLQTLLVS